MAAKRAIANSFDIEETPIQILSEGSEHKSQESHS